MAEANPWPGDVTDALWRLWTDRPNPAWKLGGIKNFNKKGYHNSVDNNYKNYPGNYSIRFALDNVDYNRDVARAIDTTKSTEEMIKWTKRMRDSALDPNDHRLDCVREFYGTLDGKTVYGLIHDSEHGEWRKASADLTHTWHGHTGIFAAFVHLWERLRGVLSVWKGESLREWKAEGMLPEQGDKGEEVKFFQFVHNRVRTTVQPPSPLIEKTDGDYGEKTAAAFADFWRKSGGKSEKPFLGQKVTGWLAQQYHEALAQVSALPATSPTQAQINAAVSDYLDKNLPATLKLEGTIKGVLQK